MQGAFIVRRSAPVCASRPTRRTFAPRASIVNDIADGIARIFSPPTSTLSNLKRSEGEYKGSRSHTRPSGPFKDGFDASKSKSTPAAMTPPVTDSEAADKSAKVDAAPGAPNSGPMDYLGSAAQAVVSKNFPSRDDEPEWMNREPQGYKGSTHRGHGSDGFHVKQ